MDSQPLEDRSESVHETTVGAEHLVRRPPEVRPGWNVPQPEHIPQPTYWPAVMALGITLLFWGIIAAWGMSALGLLLFIVALIGWIGEWRHAE